jgi:hypothetical protein
MWRAWMVVDQQADTPIPLVEDGSRQTVPRRWLAMGVDAPDYAVAAGPVVVADIDAAVAWALAQGYKLAPSWGSEVL